MKRAIISLATERGNYYKGLTRLAESLRGNFSGDFLGFMGEASVGAPKHSEVPYGFKVYAWEYVQKLGYDEVLWLDSSVYAVKQVDQLFDIIHHKGYLMQEAGCWLGQWCNDFALNKMALTREKAMTIPCYGNAGMLGLNLAHEKAKTFLTMWGRFMDAGCFNGSWEDHRPEIL